MHQRPLPAGDPVRAALAAIARVLALALLLVPRPLDSHEVPARVAVIAWVQPTDSALRVLVRVPLEAMRDLDFPLRADSTLDLVRVRPLLAEAARLWIAGALALWADGSPVGDGRIVTARVSLPDDRSFASLDSALAHVGTAPHGNEVAIRWQQALLDVEIVYPAAAPGARLSLTPALAHLGVRTSTVLRLVLPSGVERAFHYVGDPGRIELDPRWSHAAQRFVREGFRHILGGLDHLLFVLCLVLPVRQWRSLVAIVTAFTLAHSLTLAAAALGLVPTAAWFPSLVETAIAASIIWLAAENFFLSEERLARRWRMAFGLGLIHGFGFSFALAEQLQFAGGHLLTALAAFNLGVELGQLLVLAVALVLLGALHRAVAAERALRITWIGSAIIAHTAYHWMAERANVLGEYRAAFRWPVLDLSFAIGAVRVALLAAVALAVALAFQQILQRLLPE
ncbi:MAG: HupE/UreJ family protein [Gemmatimonadaceae bacterium]